MKRLNSYVWAVLAACWLVSAPAYAAKANKDIVAHEWEAYVDTLKPLGGRLSSLLPAQGAQLEARQAPVDNVPGIMHVAVADEVDGGRLGHLR